QALVASGSGSGYPGNRVICAINRCHPRRAVTALVVAPSEHNCRRTTRRDLIGPDRASLVMKHEICSLASVVRDSRCTSVSTGDISLGDRHADAAEMVAINQVGIGIFAQSKHKLRRCGSRHIDQCGADTAMLGVTLIE